ncbi:ABC transporter substrate-binding protein [Hornefia butyriciproducens]|uniref:ABC transporter substrate-binding protein n=1 Tax=Hornefia butyriciproducens TaxID=2652293 RepID=UPI0023F52428|nr:ABC transporter substrate-binding protein [Hornefia butyriciproducens]MDD6299143.1 ABC transporter substrate-binding protein [Hornefia butyriciproducens]
MKKKLLVVLLATVVAIAFSFTGCGSKDKGGSSAADKEKTKAGGKTLIIKDGSWSGIDLFQVSDWNDMQGLVADSILTKNPKTGKAMPGIASKSVWSKDGKTWTLTFPKGMKYSTGKELEPEDFVASVKYGLKVSPYKDGYSNIKNMEIKGRKVIVHFKKFHADTEFNFMTCFTGIIDKDEIDSMTKDDMLWGCHPYGAYYVDKYEPGAYVILKANPGYKTNNPKVKNKGVCPIKRIKIVFSGEDFTLAKGVQNGDYDVLSTVPANYYKELKKSDKVTVKEAASAQVYYAELNTTKGALKDAKVREAIIRAIDRETMVKHLNSYEKPAYSLILDKCLNYDSSVPSWYKAKYGYNKDAALKLLKEAGYKKNKDGIMEKNGKTLSFTFDDRDDTVAKRVGQSIQKDLKAIGIEMKISTQEWSYVNQDVVDGNFDMAYLGLGWSEPFLLMDNFCMRQEKEKDMVSNLDPKGQKALIQKARETVDYDARTPIITQLQKKLFDYKTIIPLLDENNYRCWRSEIKGVVWATNGDFYLNDVKTDKDGNFRNVK